MCGSVNMKGRKRECLVQAQTIISASLLGLLWVRLCCFKKDNSSITLWTKTIVAWSPSKSTCNKLEFEVKSPKYYDRNQWRPMTISARLCAVENIYYIKLNSTTSMHIFALLYIPFFSRYSLFWLVGFNDLHFCMALLPSA